MALIVTKHSGSYWRITIDNPPLNLMDPDMTDEFQELMSVMEKEDELKVVVFDSADPEYFISHIDLLKAGEFNLEPGPTGMSAWPDVARRLELACFITIGLVRGRARGVGSEFIQVMDMCFASKEKARLAQIEVGCGLIPGGGGLERLPYKIGKSRALEVIVGANDFDADTAALYGWVNRSIPDAELDKFVDDLAKRISGFERNVISAAKGIIYERLGLAPVEAFRQSQKFFFDAVALDTTKSRIKWLFANGFQQRGDFELNLGDEVGRLTTE